MMEIAIRSAFLNCGQNCVSAERFYIHESLYDRFVAEAKKRTSALRVGYTCPPNDRKDGTIVRDCDVGAMTMKPQVAHVQRLVDDAIANGAKLICGGKQRIDAEFPDGLYFEPTVLADVTHNIRIANEEVFGPVMTIMKFKTEEEVIRLANCTEYGLSSSIFTRDLAYVVIFTLLIASALTYLCDDGMPINSRGQRVASKMHAGMCSINDWGINHTIQSLPFGGVKRSGFGAFNGKEGLRGFSLARATVCDRFPVRLWVLLHHVILCFTLIITTLMSCCIYVI
jgi:acyl-CoA reductase-like NAD-dependent aldehyde dehydrogenase